jgi:hypothetical protein
MFTEIDTCAMADNGKSASKSAEAMQRIQVLETIEFPPDEAGRNSVCRRQPLYKATRQVLISLPRPPL